MSFITKMFLNFYFILTISTSFFMFLLILFIESPLIALFSLLSIIVILVIFAIDVFNVDTIPTFPNIAIFKKKLLCANDIYFCVNEPCKKIVRQYRFTLNNTNDFCSSCGRHFKKLEPENSLKWMDKRPDSLKISAMRFTILYLVTPVLERNKIKKISKNIEQLVEIKTFLEFQGEGNITPRFDSKNKDEILKIEETIKRDLKILRNNVISEKNKEEIIKIQNKLSFKIY